VLAADWPARGWESDAEEDEDGFDPYWGVLPDAAINRAALAAEAPFLARGPTLNLLQAHCPVLPDVAINRAAHAAEAPFLACGPTLTLLPARCPTLSLLLARGSGGRPPALAAARTCAPPGDADLAACGARAARARHSAPCRRRARRARGWT
jgi:hypothetical protein